MPSSDLYRIEIFMSEEDAGYIAVVPDLPGCSSWGTDRLEAATEIASAIDAWIGAMEKAGNPIPAPSISPYASTRN